MSWWARQFDFIEECKQSFKNHGFIEIEKMKNFRNKIEDFEETKNIDGQADREEL